MQLKNFCTLGQLDFYLSTVRNDQAAISDIPEHTMLLHGRTVQHVRPNANDRLIVHRARVQDRTLACEQQAAAGSESEPEPRASQRWS